MIREVLHAYANTQRMKLKRSRTKTIGASEIGLCARQTHYRKTGTQPDKDFIDTPATRGTMMEKKFWYPALKRAYGDNLLYAGPHQITLSDGILSATPDGIIIDLPRDCLQSLGVKTLGFNNCIVVEGKTIDPRVNITEAKHENILQTQVQLGLIRRYTQWRPNYAVISYIDASSWHEVSEFIVTYDDEVFKKAKERARMILNGDLTKPEGWIAGGKECGYCPFAIRCGVERRDVPAVNKDADPQFTAEIIDMCKELQAIKAKVKKDEALENEQIQAIKDRLREKGVNVIEDVVRWSAVKGRISYDNEAIRNAALAAGIDIEDMSTVGEPTDRLQILL